MLMFDMWILVVRICEVQKFDLADIGKAQFSGANVDGASLIHATNLSQAYGIEFGSLFFRQDVLESIVASSEPGFSIDNNRLKTPNWGTFRLVEAYRAVELLEGSDRSWLGMVLTKEEWRQKADMFTTDLVEINGTALSLSPGFLGERQGDTAVPDTAEDKKPADQEDMTLLEDFLLGQLNS